MTGELMRLCVSMAASRDLEGCKAIRQFVRGVYNGMF